MENNAIEKVVNAINKDNARRERYNAVIGDALAIWNKYAGKQYGTKTKDKIHNEIKQACGINAWFNGDEMNFMPCDENGYNDMHYAYKDFEIYGKYDTETHEHYVFIDKNNTIKAIKPEQVYLNNCHDIVEDVNGYAAEIINAFQNLSNKYNELEQLANEYNKLIPSGMVRKHLYDSSFANWLF